MSNISEIKKLVNDLAKYIERNYEDIMLRIGEDHIEIITEDKEVFVVTVTQEDYEDYI